MTVALDLTHADPSIRPADDFFRHVNGHWLDTEPIPADKPRAGSFDTLREQSLADARAIIEGFAVSPADDEQRKVALLYSLFMDTDALDRAALTPLQAVLDRVDAIETPADLWRHVGWSMAHGLGTIMSMGADADMDDPRTYAMWTSQGGLGLPDRDYYLEDAHAEMRDSYRAHVVRSLELAGVQDAPAQAELILGLETEIARLHWDRVRCRDMVAIHNPMSMDAFMAASPELPWASWLEGAGLTASELPLLNVEQPDYFVGLQALVTPERLDAWRSWARWEAVRSLSSYLTSALDAEHFDFYRRTLSGTPEQPARWKRGVDLVSGYLGEAVGKEYVARHFPPESKRRMDELVANLLNAYAESIRALDWMGDDTKAEALHKLDGFSPKIGYPSSSRDYSGLELVEGDLVASLLAASAFEFRYEVDKLPRPVDPEEWEMLPQEVNAYYHPLRNEIVFPAAILQPPFFNPDADDAINYGGIGAVIGHEIGHGFDDQGSTCDGDGRLRDWWTDEDRQAFSARTSALIAQYDALTPRQLEHDDPKPHVNGAFTIGENTGDLGGLGIALKAWRLATDGVDPEPIDGLTGLQRVFAGYAQIWCSKSRDELARQLLVIDPHSPAEFRCNQIVRNIDAFHEAFGVTPDDPMWMDPADRVTIW